MEDERDSRSTSWAAEGVVTAKPQNLGYGKDVHCTLIKKLSSWTRSKILGLLLDP